MDNREIEYKFLVDFEALALHVKENCNILSDDILSQSYIYNTKDHTLRSRFGQRGKSYLTYKGASNGPVRTELEVRVPKFVAKLASNFGGAPIRKRRVKFIDAKGFIWEYDIFLNLSIPLEVVELEVKNPLSTRDLKDLIEDNPWIQADVTNDSFYYNSNLTRLIKHGT